MEIKEKDRLCKLLHVFERHNPIDPQHPELHEKILKYNNPDLLSSLYDGKGEYVNTSTPRAYIVEGKKYAEDTCACLFLYETETIFIPKQESFKVYFISDVVYNMNDVREGPAIIGRFVYHEGKVCGLIEERPIKRGRSFSLGSKETLSSFYLERRAPHLPVTSRF